MIRLGSDICTDFEASSGREWLETNGIGGFASGTVSGANSRRYHGLLTVATRPPLGRYVLLSKIEETLIVGGERYDLSANRYPNRIHPEGFRYLTGFRLDPVPTWTYEVEGIVLEKKIFLAHGEHSLVCRWSMTGPAAELEVRPLIACRDYHHLRVSGSGLAAEFTVGDGLVSIDPLPGLPALHFAHNGTGVGKTGFWYRDFEYAIERERGFDYRENLLQPFAVRFDLSSPATVIASTRAAEVSEAAAPHCSITGCVSTAM